MTLGGIAGLIAAVAFVALVALVRRPAAEARPGARGATAAVHDLGQESVPILTELQDTVRATNDEIGRLGLVTDEVATVSTERGVGDRERGPDVGAVHRTRSAAR